MKKIFSILFCAILFCSFMIVPTMAAEINYIDYPDFSDLLSEVSDRPKFGYTIAQSDSDSIVYLAIYSSVSTADADFLVKQSSSSSVLGISLIDDDNNTYTFSYNVYAYRPSDTTWSRSTGNTNVTTGKIMMTINHYIISSTHDIYKRDGTLFFQAPPKEITLAEAIQKVVKEQIPATKEIIQNQMMTIVLCGVGCLALLISLVLLVRVLRRYLLR